MSAVTEPRWSQPRAGSKGAPLSWLDALSSGACTPEAFLAAMRDQFQGDSEEGWEVISLLDQYYHRGKIKADLFHTLKTRLESSALMVDEDMRAGVRPVAASLVTSPAAAAQKKAAPVPRAPVRETAAGAVREVAVGDMLRDRYRVRGV